MTGTEAPRPAIVVEHLSKRYGRMLALDDVSLSVGANDMFALLGPNGAGKTTLIHILCTILAPDGGSASVAGFDVKKQAVKARRNIGVVFQEPSLDDRLTAYENLNFHGLVYQVGGAERKQRITEMLELVELSDWRDKLVRTFSSGMKRRLEIARALLHNPRILFLDEPTVGLDAQSRERIWAYLDQLRRQRELCIVVTTHYIEEVENCDRVCIIDHGKILADGTPDALKAAHGSELVRVTPRDKAAAEAIRERYPDAKDGHGGTLVLAVDDVNFIDGFLASFGTRVSQVSLDRPSLESVFLSLTGRELRDKGADEQDRMRAAGRRAGRR
ncbi:ABC transporter ATP-binding protein [Arsenicitalea aurantiaca]|uniref:ABC transporter ATP-binding protein n=1 Tax=Arsenicitalea aurantiaca TaxID=1783274 RepID=A0A433XAH5_9HYPH|nr:ABC transporter ATP-binding protein [Arsenicitalea aurantiaca]RUT31054.1 ABC transporter ATP-binding protein [Arsenicitalea aurantiaca]